MKLALDWKNAWNWISQESAMQQLARYVNVLLLILLAYTCAALTWRLLPAPDTPPAPKLAMSTAKKTGQTQGVAAKSWNIAQWHIFGQRSLTNNTVRPPAEAIPETKLNLILRGVFASEDQVASGAIIAGPDGKDSFYSIGAQLPGGAELKEIYPDRVVLLRNQRYETLRMPKESLGLELEEGVSPTAAPPPQVGSRASLRQYRDVLKNNPQRLAEMINIAPQSEAGEFTGYRINPGRDRALFTQLGLMPGDVVTVVNGIALDTPAKSLEVMKELSEAGELRLEIKRNGVPRSIVVDINN